MPMNRISKDVVNVVGDSLEACLYSRFLLENNPDIKKINHYITGNLGGVYADRVKNEHYNILFLNAKTREKIAGFLPSCKFELIVDNYIKVPQRKIQFSNTYDGLIRYPFTVKSFEMDLDYNDAILSPMSFDTFIKEYKEVKNITRLMKMIFSDSFYGNIIKKIGGNQWNINLSQVDPIKLYRNILNLDYIESDEIVEYYHPVEGATKLCEELLNHQKINVINTDRKSIKNVISNERSVVTYVQDFVDYYMNFMFGAFDYVQYQTEVHKKSISHHNVSRILTPYDKQYFMYFEKDSITYKSWSKDVKISSNDFEYFALVPSMSNYKKLIDYKKFAAVSQTIKIVG